MNKINIKGLLIDLDGVIYNDTQLIPGATETIKFLQQNKIPFRFITNTTKGQIEISCLKRRRINRGFLIADKSTIDKKPTLRLAFLFFRYNENN